MRTARRWKGREEGLRESVRVDIQALEETAEKGYVVLPFVRKPGAGGDLDDDALDAVSGGAAAGCAVCGAG